ncbi:MAG: RagB/SusD family nutrient uptake outer membrane protein [Parabacteroides sp.]
MKNGLPVYANGSGYKGDMSIGDVRADRDERLQLFMMTPSEVLTEGQVEFVDTLSSLPNILAKEESRNVTGYQLRKGLSNNWSRDWDESEEGSPIFRATEAYLNYIEASCIENNGSSIDGKAQGYWRQLRERAGLPSDYNVTVAATDLGKESDWAVYSAGQQVTPLLITFAANVVVN